MDAQKVAYLNAGLFAGVLALGVMIMLPRPEIPVVTQDSIAWLDATSTPGAVDTTGDGDSTYPNFGQSNLFETLKPKPTPAPTPPPTPAPDPRLKEATSNWAINAVTKKRVSFTDRRSKEEYNVEVGQVLIFPVGRKSIRITVESTDPKKAEVVFRYDGDQGVQRETLSARDAWN